MVQIDMTELYSSRCSQVVYVNNKRQDWTRLIQISRIYIPHIFVSFTPATLAKCWCLQEYLVELYYQTILFTVGVCFTCTEKFTMCALGMLEKLTNYYAPCPAERSEAERGAFFLLPHSDLYQVTTGELF